VAQSVVMEDKCALAKFIPDQFYIQTIRVVIRVHAVNLRAVVHNTRKLITIENK
jgi:hypothetical protein